MKAQNIVIATVMAFALLLSNVSTVLAVPPLPSSFYGTVMIGWVKAPIGTVVSARINGVQYASMVTIANGGDTVYFFDVPGDDLTTPEVEGGVAGNTIVFYVGNDATGQTAPWVSGTNVQLNLTVSTNAPPVITEGASTSVTMSEDGSPTAFSLTLHATDADGDPRTWSISTQALHGTASASGTGSSKVIGYTPTANYNGADSFVVQVSDGQGGADTITVNVTINPVNDPPVANPQSVTTPRNTPRAITLTGSDVEGSPLTFSIVASPSHGSLSGTPPNLSYIPAAGYTGSDSFTFRVNDGTANSNTATVSITVSGANNPPTDIALSSTSIKENQPAGTVVGALSTTDPDVGDAFTYTLCGGADGSSFQISGNGLQAAVSFDYEVKNSYAICVRSTDIGGLFYDKNFTITISNAIDTPTFADVPLDYWSWQYIEAIYAVGITSGCGTNPLIYCPTLPVTRAQMAVFLLRGIHGSSYVPPAASGTVFTDVPASYWAAAWVEQLAREGITSGCAASWYCPEAPVNRDQMAIFLLRAKHGSTYTPPAVAAGTGFTDVPASYWAAAWIKQLAAEGVTSGCGGSNYCPLTAVTRDQMAVFLQRVFNLPLP
jgi:hypothetical protein